MAVLRRVTRAATLALVAAAAAAQSGADKADKHDYPTVARVEYVQECIRLNNGDLSFLYKCSCVIDHIAQELTYEEFVEAGTYSRYSSLAGKVGGIFRDSDEARAKTKRYRGVEDAAYRACGFTNPPPR